MVPVLLCALGLLLLLRFLPPPRPPANTITDTAEAAEEALPHRTASPGDLAQQWGIKLAGLRLAMNGNMLDLRYTVLDPAKAGQLMQEEDAAWLIDETTGTTVPLPQTLRAGSSRRLPQQLALGATYSFNFPNAGRRFKPGSRVTVVMGKFRAEHLAVE